MTWWCAASKEPWSWSFRAYPGIWALMAAMLVGYVSLWRRGRPDRLTAVERRKPLWFGLGFAVLWGATDWPLGTLGAGYLASAHMVQYMLYTLVAAPLLLLGTPEWVARPIVDRLHLGGALRVVAKPVVAAVTFNLVLIATHAPWTVDTFRAGELGSFALDMLWLASGLVLWTPLVSPLKELVHPSPAVRCIYLFLASGAIPMVPGGILTFSNFPLYATYELAPRVAGISAGADQQSAGIIMKIGNIPIVWGVIFVTFFKWAAGGGSHATLTAEEADAITRAEASTTPATSTPVTSTPATS